MAGHSFGRVGSRYGSYMYGPHAGSYYSIYSPSNIRTRLLIHTGLPIDQQLCIYPFVPEETIFFTWDVLTKRDVAFQKTLASNLHSKWAQVKDDTVIKEQFKAPGGLAFSWEFFHCIERMYQQDPDYEAGESLIWRPLDRTHKAFTVDMVNLLVNGEEWGPEFKGYTEDRDFFGINQMEIHYKIRHEDAPQVNLFMVGGSDTPENTLFVENPAV